MSDVIERMHADRASLQEKMEKMQAELDAIKAEYDELDTAIRVMSKYREGRVKRIRIGPLKPQTGETEYGAKKAAIVKFAKDAIAKHGPMTSRGLLERMDAAGLSDAVGGPDIVSRIKNLSAILSRDDRFESDRDAGGWKYKEEAPQGGNQEGLI